MEQHNIKMVSVPVDMNTAAITGARIKLDSGDRVAIMCQFGDSTAALVQLTLNQHTAASGGTSKVLSVANAYFHKAGAATSFTKVQPTAAASAYDVSSVFSDAEGVLVMEVRGEDLDVDGGFAWVSVDFADSTAAKLLAASYIVSDLRHRPGYSVAI